MEYSTKEVLLELPHQRENENENENYKTCLCSGVYWE